MFCLVENANIILGPISWSKNQFQYALSNDLGINYDVPGQNDDNLPIIITDTVKILPTHEPIIPQYNNKIQQLSGPFYVIGDSSVSYEFGVVDRDPHSVINELLAKVAENRWMEEVKGIMLDIQNTKVFVPTNREDRNIFAQALLLNIPSTQWKFGDIWLTITLADIQIITSAILNHIQKVFAWEASKVDEIKGCLSQPNPLAALDAVVLTYTEVI